MKKLKKIAKNLDRLLSNVLKISVNDYRIVVSDRIGWMIDIYFLEEPFGKFHDRQDLTIALQTIETVIPDTFIHAHYCNKKHFNEVGAA